MCSFSLSQWLTTDSGFYDLATSFLESFVSSVDFSYSSVSLKTIVLMEYAHRPTSSGTSVTLSKGLQSIVCQSIDFARTSETTSM